MATPQTVLSYLSDAAARGERTALIVLTAIEGGAARGLGTLMAVSESGWCGSLSGGCTEAALAGEARRVIASAKAERLRIGAGSPLIDIRLPCGSAIELLIVPEPDLAAIHMTQSLSAGRRSATLIIDEGGTFTAREATPADRTGWTGPAFCIRIDPPLRLVIAGHGEEVEALARQAQAWGTDTLILTPDERLAARERAVLLKSPSSPAPLALDAWSALVLLFHDHDWEVPLLQAALGQEALWIGAMGSRATHQRRLDALAAAGISHEQAGRIKGPIGLIPAARDPETLALSVLAEVVAAYKARGFP